MSRLQIDLIDMRYNCYGDYNYVAHVMDHWSKFHVMLPLKEKTAKEVAEGLYQRVFSYVGIPRIMHHDNGPEFVNHIVEELIKDWGGDDVVIVRGRPRHSQSQGTTLFSYRLRRCVPN